MSTVDTATQSGAARRPAAPTRAPRERESQKPAAAGAPPVAPAQAGPEPAHLALPRLVERLHRRFLDLLRAELGRLGVSDLAPVQMMLLLNMDAEEIAVQDLIQRGNYLRTQAFYNVRKMVETGYLEQERGRNDRRTVRIKLTPKARALCAEMRRHQSALAETFARTEDKPDNLELAYRILRRLERSWDDHLRYGRV